MRSCCFGCDHVDESKSCRRCMKCERRLALLDRLDYLAQARSPDGEAYHLAASVTRYNGPAAEWSG